MPISRAIIQLGIVSYIGSIAGSRIWMNGVL